MNYGKSENLLNKLFGYINETDDDPKSYKNQTEKKPSEHKQDSKEDLKIEKLAKEKNTIIVDENKIICDDIISKFFSLDEEKYISCIDKLTEWGFNITFEYFIKYYYLRVVSDFYLREYIISNLSSILITLKDRLEASILNNIDTFDFTDKNTDHKLRMLKENLKNKETALLLVKSKGFNEFAPVNEKIREKLSGEKEKDLRAEIMNKLRFQNPELENI